LRFAHHWLDNCLTRDYARVSHSRQWSNYNIVVSHLSTKLMLLLLRVGWRHWTGSCRTGRRRLLLSMPTWRNSLRG